MVVGKGEGQLAPFRSQKKAVERDLKRGWQGARGKHEADQLRSLPAVRDNRPRGLAHQSRQRPERMHCFLRKGGVWTAVSTGGKKNPQAKRPAKILKTKEK